MNKYYFTSGSNRISYKSSDERGRYSKSNIFSSNFKPSQDFYVRVFPAEEKFQSKSFLYVYFGVHFKRWFVDFDIFRALFPFYFKIGNLNCLLPFIDKELAFDWRVLKFYESSIILSYSYSLSKILDF